MAGFARQVQLTTASDSRGRQRRKLLLGIELASPAALSTTTTVHNLSETGLLIEADEGLEIGDLIEVHLPHAGVRSAEVVWTDDRLAGCKFIEVITPGAVSAALLRGRFDTALAPTTSDDDACLAVDERSQEPAGELSLRQKMLAVLGLATLAWLPLASAAAWLLL